MTTPKKKKPTKFFQNLKRGDIVYVVGRIKGSEFNNTVKKTLLNKSYYAVLPLAVCADVKKGDTAIVVDLPDNIIEESYGVLPTLKKALARLNKEIAKDESASN